METTERRRFERYKAPDNAITVLRNSRETIGYAKDISKGGLLFEYPVLGWGPIDAENKSKTELDIFIPGSDFRLSRIPCSLVHDKAIIPDTRFITSISMRRCGIMFNDISEGEERMLETLLEKCEPLIKCQIPSPVEAQRV